VPADKWQITGFNHLNQWFNNYVGVKPGYGLTAYLGYPNNIDNYIAVAWWLDIKMKYTKCPVYSMADLKKALKGISPENSLSAEFLATKQAQS
jgi:hypothetical protein